jgi:hypothetical protein
LGGALTALALAVELNANHLQITYYLLITVVFVGLGEGYRLIAKGERNYFFKAVGFLVVAAFLAVLPNYSNLILTNEYGKDSTRGQSEITVDNKDQKKTSGLPIEYATQWSYGQGETFSLLIPNINGGASKAIANYDKSALKGVYDDSEEMKRNVGGQSAYFGDQPFTSGPVYVGAIVCFLFILGLFIVKDSIKWWLLAATILSIMLAWGKNLEWFTEFFFKVIPGYNKFRSVSMTLVIAELTMPLLGMLALKEIVKNPTEVKSKMKWFYTSLGITAGIALLVFVSPTSFVTPVGDNESQQITDAVVKQGGTKANANDFIVNLETARTNIVQGDAMRSLLFILAAGIFLALFLYMRFNVVLLAAGMSVLMLWDMAGVSYRFMHDDKDPDLSSYEKKTKPEDQFSPTAADLQIMQDSSKDYRVMNLAVSTWQDASTSYYHMSIGGYHGAKLKRIQELYEQVMEKNENEVRTALQMQTNDSVLRDVLSRQAALNMLNTKYIIFNPDGGVLTNRYACGNAWFVKEVKMVDNADAEINAVKNFSPKRTAIIDKVFDPTLGGFTPKYDSTAKIQLTAYEPNDLKYSSNANTDQLAVFSEIYYAKGWNAYVDGKLTPHVRADFVLRAMRVPAGNHEIEFKFEPSAYFTGEKIALAGSILLLIFFGVGIYRQSQDKEGEIAAGEDETTEDEKAEENSSKGKEKVETKSR